MEAIIAAVVALVAIVGGVYVIYGIVRFSIISPRRTKGASTRLRHPAPDGIAALTGFPPPTELIDFYRHAPFVELVEYYLVDGTKNPRAIWFVGGLNPLTLLDVREALKISGAVPGIPIGDDMDKGTYFVARNGAVMLDSPNVVGRLTEVAPSIAAFAGFQVRDTPPE